jgi:hypothetical protein
MPLRACAAMPAAPELVPVAGDFGWMFRVSDAAPSVVAAPWSVYAHSSTEPGADG